MDIGAISDRGMRRRKNEDAFYVDKERRFFIVCDGVGGNRSGEVASDMAARALGEYFEENRRVKFDSDGEAEKYFAEGIERVNNRVLLKSRENSDNSGMATTLVAIYICNGNIYIVNVGDSRGYLYRNDSLIQITEDHTYVNSLVQAGLITREEARTHKNKNMITRAVGAEDSVEADIFGLEPKEGDILMICSDGLYGEVSGERIKEILSNDERMQGKCDKLADSANVNGGHDNITVVCIRIMEEDINE